MHLNKLLITACFTACILGLAACAGSGGMYGGQQGDPDPTEQGTESSAGGGYGGY